jgi:hypothetical protein
LKIVRTRIFALDVWAEGTDITGALVDQTMPDHLVLSLEALTSLAAETALDGAEMRAHGAVDVFVGTEQGFEC